MEQRIRSKVPLEDKQALIAFLKTLESQSAASLHSLINADYGAHAVSAGAECGHQIRRTRMCLYSVQRPGSCACNSIGPSSRFKLTVFQYRLAVDPNEAGRVFHAKLKRPPLACCDPRI